MEDSLWAPYLFILDGRPAGVHVNMLKHAFEHLPYTLTIKTMPWKRCLNWARAGRVDGVLSAIYTKGRAEYLHFPIDATNAGSDAPNRIMSVRYVVVSSASAPEWDGKADKLPLPIGVPMGYATAERLQARGLKVTEGLQYDNLFRMLIRGRIGSLVIINELADLYLLEPPYKDKLRKHRAPYETNPLFVPFANKGKVSRDQATIIWNAISSVRDDAALMKAITEQALTQSRRCFKQANLCD